MKPVNQTIFHGDALGRRGNCLQAVIASIVEKPLEEVPHFAAIEDDTWFDQTCKFLNDNGFEVYDCDAEELPHVKDNFVMAIGKSSRGCSHVVLYYEGKMIHDPHPSKEGILNIDWCSVLSQLPQQKNNES